MKILFSGCSYVMGAEVEKSQRFSHLVCDKLNATEYNIAYGGRGNLMSALLAITEAERIKPDIIVFGFTHPCRTFVHNSGLDFPVDKINEGKYILSEWKDTDFHDNTIQLRGGNKITDNVPNANVLIETFPAYRNSIQTQVEQVAVYKMLVDYAQVNNIKLCAFQSFDSTEYITRIHDVDITNTSIQWPPKDNLWLQERMDIIARREDDVRTGNHPGPTTHRIFANLILDKLEEL